MSRFITFSLMKLSLDRSLLVTLKAKGRLLHDPANEISVLSHLN